MLWSPECWNICKSSACPNLRWLWTHRGHRWFYLMLIQSLLMYWSFEFVLRPNRVWPHKYWQFDYCQRWSMKHWFDSMPSIQHKSRCNKYLLRNSMVSHAVSLHYWNQYQCLYYLICWRPINFNLFSFLMIAFSLVLRTSLYLSFSIRSLVLLTFWNSQWIPYKYLVNNIIIQRFL